MIRALFISRENMGTLDTVTEVRIIEQDTEDLCCELPDNFPSVIAYITEEDGDEVLKIGFMNAYNFPESVDMTWETLPTFDLLRVTLHDVDITYDPRHDAFFPECIGEPVMTLYDVLSPERAAEVEEAALIAEAKAKAGERPEDPDAED